MFQWERVNDESHDDESFSQCGGAPFQMYSPGTGPFSARGGKTGTGRFAGLGDYIAPVAPSTTGGSWLTQLTDIVKQALPAYQQVKILREQEKRRAAGLPPLESEQLAPTFRVQGGLDPGTMNLGKIALWGGLALGGAFLFMALKK
jgi:hypothetical protein